MSIGRTATRIGIATVLLSLTALFALRACAGDVSIKEWKRVRSPDGRVDAVVLSSGGGGALGSDVFWVTLVPAGTGVTGKENDVFNAMHVNPLNIRWLEPRVVEIAYGHAVISGFVNHWSDSRVSGTLEAPVEIRLRALTTPP